MSLGSSSGQLWKETVKDYLATGVTYAGKYMEPGSEAYIFSFDRISCSDIYSSVMHVGVSDIWAHHNVGGDVFIANLNEPAATFENKVNIKPQAMELMAGRNVIGIVHDDTRFEEFMFALNETNQKLEPGKAINDWIIFSLGKDTQKLSRYCVNGQRVEKRTKLFGDEVVEFLSGDESGYRPEDMLIIGTPPISTSYARYISDKIPGSKAYLHMERGNNGSALQSDQVKGKQVIIVDSVWLEQCEEELAKAKAALGRADPESISFMGEYAPISNDNVDFALYPTDDREKHGIVRIR